MIGSGRVFEGSGQKVAFKSSLSDIIIKMGGPFEKLEVAQICTQYPKSVQHTYLVDVCDESKDRYRFGFNGMEKDNELKGIGNSLDFGARMYDSKIGKFLSKDPLQFKFPNSSPYGFVDNCPIIFKDPN